MGFLVLFASFALADGVPFSISSAQLPPSSEDGQSVISRLKHQAVVDYLMRQLGGRYGQYETAITPEFTEKFVLDYKVNRSAENRSKIELSGHLDADALKRWIRVSETKSAGSHSLKPYFVISSSLPGLTIFAGQAGSKIKETTVGQTIFSSLGNLFQKFNARLATLPDNTLSLVAPPRKDSDLRPLREAVGSAGYNSAVWVHLSPCRGCGTRMEISFYTLPQLRLALVQTENLPLEAKDFGVAERVRNAIKEPLKEFSSDFEELVSTGTLFSLNYRLLIEGIDSYKSFKQIETALGKQDFIVQSVLKRAEPQLAEFSILSSLDPNELGQRMHLGDFPGFQLKTTRVDGQTITVRYVRQQ